MRSAAAARLCALLLVAGCQFDPSVPGGATVRCVDGTCPTGFTCRPQVGLCVPLSGAAGTAPRITAATITPSRARHGTTVEVSLTVDEALLTPPRLTLVSAAGARDVSRTGGAGLEHRYAYGVDSAVDTEGLARLVADLVDAEGTEATAQPVGTLELDFTPPSLGAADFSAPRHGDDAGVLAVRPGEAVAVRVTASEALAPGARLRPTGSCDGGLRFDLRSERAGLLDFATGAGAPGDCEATLALEGAVDLAGNSTPALPLGLRLVVDGAPPEISQFAVLRVSDGGALPQTLFSRQPGFDRFVVRAEVDATATQTVLELDDVPLPGCACVGTRCECAGQVAASAAEGAHVFSVTAVDLAGNAATRSVQVRYDFTPPALVPSSTHVAVRLPPGCPLPTTTALAAQGSVEVDFSVDEPATVGVGSQPAGLTFTRTAATTTHFAFLGQPAPGATTQAFQVRAEASDEAGNAATLALADRLAVDVDAPPEPDAGAFGALLFVRAPWGQRDAGPSFTLRGQPGLADVGVTLQVLEGTSPVALTSVTDAGFEVPLGVDRRALSIRVFDDACNSSPVVRVRDVEWHATLGGKVRGRTFENPHLLERREPSSAATTQSVWTTEDTLDAPVLQEGGVTVQRAGVVPSARDEQSLTYDDGRGRFIMFGGSLVPSFLGMSDELWEWEPRSRLWTSRTPTPRPQAWPLARYAAATVFDPHRRRLVVFSGYTFQAADDLWEWEPVTGVWTNRTPSPRPAAWPTRRSRTLTGYDPQRRKVVLFGGAINGGASWTDELWEWDGRTASWTNRTPSPRPAGWPPLREYAAGTVDGARGRLVMFGGRPGSGADTNELWECDLATLTWTNRTPTPRPSSWPAARAVAQSAYDPVRQRVLFYGSFSFADELWEWDGVTGTWTDRTPTPRTPDWPPGAMSAIALDPSRGLLTGVTQLSSSLALYEYDADGGTWAQPSPAATSSYAPGMRSHAFTFDTRRARAFAFGGFSGQRTDALNEWDSATRTWNYLTPQPRPTVWPPALALAAAVYDPISDRVLMLGGVDNTGVRSEQWEWAGDAGVWTMRGPPAPPAQWPPRRHQHALTYDPDRQRVVLFGGNLDSNASNDVWEWSGATRTWTNRTPASLPTAWPAARRNHGLAYDPRRHRTVLFGGEIGPVFSSDLWEWDGDAGTWLNRTPSPLPERWPAAHASSGFAADPRRGVLLLSSNGMLAGDDLWEWDGVAGTWTERSKTPRAFPWPPARSSAGFAYDTARGRFVLQGGLILSGEATDQYEIAVDEDNRPGVVARFNFSASGADPQVALQDVTVSAVAGASAGQAPTVGVQLSASDADALVPEAQLSAPPDAAAPVRWTTNAPQRLGRLFEGPERWVTVGLTPLGRSSSSQLAKVRLDWIELAVRYRLP